MQNHWRPIVETLPEEKKHPLMKSCIVTDRREKKAHLLFLLVSAVLLAGYGCSPGEGDGSGLSGQGKAYPSSGAGLSREESMLAWRVVPERLFSGHRPCFETGVPGNTARALFCEDGAIQVRAGRQAVLVYVWLFDAQAGELVLPGGKGGVFSLAEGYLPIPRVRWPAGGGLDVEARLCALLKEGEPPQPERDTFFELRIRLFNSGEESRRVKAMVGIVPCSPDEGGAAAASSIDVSADMLSLDGKGIVRFSRKPGFFGTCSRGARDPGEELCWKETERSGSSMDNGRIINVTAAVCAFDLDIDGAEQGEFEGAVPREEVRLLLAAQPGAPFPDPAQVLCRRLDTLIYWTGETGLNRLCIRVPDRVYFDAFRAAVAELLMRWEGDAEEDGERQAQKRETPQGELENMAMAGIALARAGHNDAARGILNRLVDGLERESRDNKEHGSSAKERAEQAERIGISLFALEDHYAFTRAEAWRGRVRGSAARAGELIATLFGEKDHGDGAENKRVEGSSSGGGQLMRGRGGIEAALYTERLWAVHGLRSAASLAAGAGDEERSDRYTGLAGELEAALDASIREAVRENSLLYVPGSPDGSLNPGSAHKMSALVWPHRIMDPLSRLVNRSFDRYWLDGVTRAGGEGADDEGDGRGSGTRSGWDGVAGLFIPMAVLRRQARVEECIDGLLDLQTVRGAFTWPESPSPGEGGEEPSVRGLISWRPSVRAAATYVIALRMLFLAEREGALVLGSGVPWSWFDSGEAINIKSAPTRFGKVSFSLGIREGKTELLLDTFAAPPNGYALILPATYFDPEVEIDGQRVLGDLNFTKKQEIPIPAGTLSVRVQ